MFDAFQNGPARSSRKALPAFMGAAVVLYAGAAVAIGFLARPAVQPPAPKEIEVSLKPPPRAPPPPPPLPVPPPVVPPPPTQQKKKAPATNAPPPPPPKPIAPLVAPKEISDAKLKEADPVPVETPVVPSDVEIPDGAVATVTTPAQPMAAAPPPPPPPAPKRSVPINLPEDAEPPEPSDDNVAPGYPEEARAKGLEGRVVLKIVISEKGFVTSVEVLKGDEPFVSASVSAVKNWRYLPAVVDGQPTAVFKIVQVPFRIKG